MKMTMSVTLISSIARGASPYCASKVSLTPGFSTAWSGNWYWRFRAGLCADVPLAFTLTRYCILIADSLPRTCCYRRSRNRHRRSSGPASTRMVSSAFTARANPFCVPVRVIFFLLAPLLSRDSLTFINEGNAAIALPIVGPLQIVKFDDIAGSGGMTSA